MAYVNQTRAANDFGIRARISALLASLNLRLANHRVYRQTVAELGQLSGRELADLGIHRSQINAIAREAAYGDN